MRAGLLRDRIDIEAQDGSADSFGDVVEAWTAIASDIPATVTPLRGIERERAAKTDAEISHKVIIRYIDGITPKNRIKFGSRNFDIRSALNVQERGRMTEIMCVERV